MTARWMTDLLIGDELVKMGYDLRRAATERRCRVGTGEFTAATGGEKKCTLDIGHSGKHECNVRRDIEGKE